MLSITVLLLLLLFLLSQIMFKQKIYQVVIN